MAGGEVRIAIVAVQQARGTLAPIPLLFLSSAFGAAMLLPVAIALGEQVIPADWTFVVILALSSQVVGQGLLVYSLRHFPPLIIGLTLLTQPSVSVIAGWLAFDEALTLWDGAGMILVAAALVLARAGERPARP